MNFLAGRLGSNLAEVWLFGSAARGDLWAAHLPMRSDIDLLILTLAPVGPLFLEAGRQISPDFWTAERFAAPESKRARAVAERVRVEGLVLYRTKTPPPP